MLNVLIAAGIEPSKIDDDQLLLAIQRISKAMSAREALRRTYAEAGFTLVPGSFELGGTVTTATDVLLYEADGHAYNWDGVFPGGGKVVPQNSTPATTGGVGPGLWLDQASSTLLLLLSAPSGAGRVGKLGGGTVEDAMPIIGELTLQIPEQFDDINSALSSISQRRIASESSVVISVAIGSYAWPTQVLSHPDAEKITITSRGGLGSITSFPGTAVAAVTGSRGAYEVKISCSPGGGVSAGDVVAISDIVGDYDAEVLGGCYRVSAVDAVSITVTVRYWQAGWSIASLTSCTIRKAPVVVDFSGQDGFVNKSSNFGKIFGIFARGNMYSYWNESDIVGTEKGTHGWYVSANTIINGAGEAGGENPFAIAGGSLSMEFCGALDFDQQGICSSNSAAIYGRDVFSSSCGRRGYYTGTAASIEMRFSYASTNYRDGAIADYGGCFNTSFFRSCGNRLDGLFSINGGNFVGPNSRAVRNGGYGAEGRSGSGMFTDSSELNGNLIDGAHGEYGAELSLVSSAMDDNLIDGVSLIFGASARMNSATTSASNNGRYGINALHSSVNYTGATLTGNTTAPIKNVESMLLNNTAYSVAESVIPYNKLRVSSPAGNHQTTADTTSVGDFIISLDGAPVQQFKLNAIFPSTDGTLTSGRSTERWNTVYSVNGVQTSSDARFKSDVREMSDAELSAGAQLAGEIGFWEWTDPQRDREHCGLTVQRVIEVMSSHGLKPFSYSFICYDEWEDEWEDELAESIGEHGEPVLTPTGNKVLVRKAGSLYQFKDNELNRFLIAGAMNEIDTIKARLKSAGL
ncbi:MAG: tail fiber domain-containing protein [Aeromonas bestiarum]